MSALKSILLHLDASPKSRSRLDIAVQLAKIHDAEVTALYAVSSVGAGYPFASAGSPEAAAMLRDIDDANLAAAKAAFDAVAARHPAPMQWGAATIQAERFFARQARYADLMILGQHEPGKEAESSLPSDFVPWVLVESGRPGLIVPYVGISAPIGQIAVVAWKNTREAASALAAALAFLRRCDRVHVVSWAEDEEFEPVGPLDIEQYLRFHGVSCTMHRNAAQPVAVGEALLSLVADVSADLLVAGCYGHSRAREWALGGVTRTILESMTVPVVMSH
jgi:nucleotide-binding universal stress UspA family protein